MLLPISVRATDVAETVPTTNRSFVPAFTSVRLPPLIDMAFKVPMALEVPERMTFPVIPLELVIESARIVPATACVTPPPTASISSGPPTNVVVRLPKLPLTWLLPAITTASFRLIPVLPADSVTDGAVI